MSNHDLAAMCLPRHEFVAGSRRATSAVASIVCGPRGERLPRATVYIPRGKALDVQHDATPTKLTQLSATLGDSAASRRAFDLSTTLADSAEQEWTALHFAARDKLQQIVKILLDSGAEVDATDVFGNTPLARSFDTADANYEIVRMLLGSGADPKKKNKQGVSPMDIARMSRDKKALTLFKKR